MSIVGLSLGTTDIPQILDAQATGVQPCMSFKNMGCPACALAMMILCVFTSIAVHKHQLCGVILPCLCTPDIKQQGMKVAYDRIVFPSSFCSSCNMAGFQRRKRPCKESMHQDLHSSHSAVTHGVGVESTVQVWRERQHCAAITASSSRQWGFEMSGGLGCCLS